MPKIFNFNSHAPCGAQLAAARYDYGRQKFQLTRPMRGATVKCLDSRFAAEVFQLTRPMRGATLILKTLRLSGKTISTHTPHAGRNKFACVLYFSFIRPFQLTRPMRGATISHKTPQVIHTKNFNSHAPCGAQPLTKQLLLRQRHFNSHAPCGAQQYER